jgi:hypothetical protein
LGCLRLCDRVVSGCDTSCGDEHIKVALANPPSPCPERHVRKAVLEEQVTPDVLDRDLKTLRYLLKGEQAIFGTRSLHRGVREISLRRSHQATSWVQSPVDQEREQGLQDQPARGNSSEKTRVPDRREERSALAGWAGSAM